MTHDSEPEPMDESLHAFLRRGAPGDDVPEGAQARVLARLAATLPIGGDDGTDGGGGAADAGPPAVSAGPSGGGFGSIAATKLALPIAVVSLLVGAGAGAALDRALGPERIRVVYVDRELPAAPSDAAPVPTPVVPAREVDDLPAAPTARAAASVPTATSAPSPVRSPAETLIAERRVLDAARASFARGDHAAALEALEAHARTYANGQLAEEREALAIRTLVAAKDIDAARVRAARFRERHPGSLMQPAVDSALANAPP